MNSEQNIKFLTNAIFNYHQKHSQDNTNLKLLEQRRKEIYKASQNILKAIEQGIITDMTKSRLQQLENKLAELDIEITKEKYRDNSLLTKEEIEKFLRKQVFEDTQDIKIRKLLVNTFVRAVYLYNDKVVILFNYTNSPDKPKFTVEENIETGKQINSALSNTSGSCLYLHSAPKNNSENELFFLLLFFVFFLSSFYFYFVVYIIFERRKKKSLKICFTFILIIFKLMMF